MTLMASSRKRSLPTAMPGPRRTEQRRTAGKERTDSRGGRWNGAERDAPTRVMHSIALPRSSRFSLPCARMRTLASVGMTVS